jgi:SAM-dependent methyltransferase
MSDKRLTVDGHYSVGGILEEILQALAGMGKDVDNLTLADLAPVDEFHIRGREATLELAKLAGLKPGLRVLDVGCGIGGSVRHLAVEHQCHVTGLDLTPEYIETAITLSRMVGLEEMVDFHEGSALEMPFDSGTFDLVWTEHAQMNIADKQSLYAEIARVLKPGGRLVFHDIFQGPGGDLHYPVPWAEEGSISFLIAQDDLRKMLESLGLHVLDWEYKSRPSLTWFQAAAERMKESGPPPLGIHLLMGDTARMKIGNIIRNLQEERITVLQAVLEKPY